MMDGREGSRRGPGGRMDSRDWLRGWITAPLRQLAGVPVSLAFAVLAARARFRLERSVPAPLEPGAR